MKRILFTLIVLFLAGCSSSKYYVSPEYNKANLSTYSMYYMPTESEITYPEDHFHDDFKGMNPQTTLQKLIDSTVTVTLKTAELHAPFSKSISPAKGNIDETIKTIVIEEGSNDEGNKFSIFLPNAETISKVIDPETGIVLFLTNMKFTHETFSFDGNTSKVFYFYTNYLIWDYKTNKAVSYGYAIGDQNANFYVEAKDWSIVIKEATENIIKEAKLGKPYKKPAKKSSSRKR